MEACLYSDSWPGFWVEVLQLCCMDQPRNKVVPPIRGSIDPCSSDDPPCNSAHEEHKNRTHGESGEETVVC